MTRRGEQAFYLRFCLEFPCHLFDPREERFLFFLEHFKNHRDDREYRSQHRSNRGTDRAAKQTYCADQRCSQIEGGRADGERVATLDCAGQADGRLGHRLEAVRHSLHVATDGGPVLVALRGRIVVFQTLNCLSILLLIVAWPPDLLLYLSTSSSNARCFSSNSSAAANFGSNFGSTMY